MALGGRQGNRFEMLINIAVGGAGNLDKVASGAKLAATNLKDVDRTLKETSVSMKSQSSSIDKFRATIEQFVDARTMLKQAEEDYQSTLAGTTVASQEAISALAAKQHQVQELEEKTKSLGETINKFAGEDLIRLNEEVSKSTINQQKLGQVNEVLEKRQKQLGTAIRKAQREKEAAAGSTTKLTGEVDKSTGAVQLNNQAWGVLQQRLGANAGAITIFRRSLGALRNQILVVMFATAGMRRVLDESYTAIRDQEAAMRGLRSMAIGTGHAMDDVSTAVSRLVADGALNMADASEAMNNMLAMNLSLEQAENLLRAVTNAASFNRDATKTLGEAVIDATEGIKNQNNRKIDAVGFTKRIADLEREYATQLGISANQLDENQTIQAIYNGLMKDAAKFSGDTARSFNTMTGAANALSVATNQSRVSLGKGLTPAIQLLFQWLTRGQDTLIEFFEAHRPDVIEVTTAAINTLTSAGSTLFRSISRIIDVAQNLFGGSSSIIGQGIIILTKIAVGKRIFNRLLGTGTVSLQKLHIQLQGYNIDLAKQGATQTLVNTETGKAVWGLDVLSLRIAHARAAIVAKQMEWQKLATTQTGIQAQWTLMKVQLLGLAAPTLALARGIGSLSGALAALGAASMKMVIFLGKLGLILIAMNVLIKVIRHFTEAEERARAFTARVQEMDRSVARLNGRLTEVIVSADKFSTVGISFGLDTIEMERARLDIEAALIGIQSINKEHRKEEDADKARHMAEQIAQLERFIEDREEVLSLAGQRILKIESELLSARADINDAYYREQEALDQRRGLEQINQAEKDFREFLEIQENFNRQRSILATRSATLVQMEERKLNDALRLINQRRRQIIIDTQENFNRDIMGFAEQRKQLQVDVMTDEVNQIRAGFELQRAATVRGVDDIVEAAEGRLNHMVDLYRRKGSEAAEALQRSIITLDTDEAFEGFLRAAADVKSDPLIAAAQGVASSLRSLNDSFLAGGVTVNDYVGRLESIRSSFGRLIDTSEDASMSQQILNNRFQEISGTIGQLIIDAQAHGSANQQLNTILTEYDGILADWIKTQIELNTAIEEALELASRQAVSQWALNTSTQILTDNIAKLEMVERSRLLRSQLEDEIKLVQIEHERAKGVAALIGPMQGLLELRRDHQATIKEERIQQQAQIEEQKSSLGIIDKQIAHYEELLSGKQDLNGHTIELEEAERNAVLATLDLLDVERSVVMENIKAYRELGKSKIEAMEALQDRLEFQALVRGMESITNSITNLASSFSDSLIAVGTEQHIYLDRLTEELAHGEITQQQFMEEKVAAQEFFNKKMELERKRALADLIRSVGREISAYAARKAASTGNIAAAVGLLVAGGAVGFLANQYASTIEAGAERDFAAAERRFQRRVDEIRDDGTGTQNARSFGGSIRAETLQVTISPTVVISGEQVFIGSGTVSEFSNEVSALILSTTQQAIDNRQVDLSSIRSLGG